MCSSCFRTEGFQVPHHDTPSSLMNSERTEDSQHKYFHVKISVPPFSRAMVPFFESKIGSHAAFRVTRTEAWKVFGWGEPVARVFWEMCFLFQPDPLPADGASAVLRELPLSDVAVFALLHVPTGASSSPRAAAAAFNEVWPSQPSALSFSPIDPPRSPRSPTAARLEAIGGRDPAPTLSSPHGAPSAHSPRYVFLRIETWVVAFKGHSPPRGLIKKKRRNPMVARFYTHTTKRQKREST